MIAAAAGVGALGFWVLSRPIAKMLATSDEPATSAVGH